MNTDNNYNPIDLSKSFLTKKTLPNQVSIQEGFNVELFEVNKNLAFIKNFGNVAAFKDDTSALLIDTGMGVSSVQVVSKLKEWGCLLYTSPSPRDGLLSRMPSSA